MTGEWLTTLQHSNDWMKSRSTMVEDATKGLARSIKATTLALEAWDQEHKIADTLAASRADWIKQFCEKDSEVHRLRQALRQERELSYSLARTVEGLRYRTYVLEQDLGEARENFAIAEEEYEHMKAAIAERGDEEFSDNLENAIKERGGRQCVAENVGFGSSKALEALVHGQERQEVQDDVEGMDEEGEGSSRDKRKREEATEEVLKKMEEESKSLREDQTETSLANDKHCAYAWEREQLGLPRFSIVKREDKRQKMADLNEYATSVRNEVWSLYVRQNENGNPNPGPSAKSGMRPAVPDPEPEPGKRMWR